MEFSTPRYWSGWPFPSPGDLPNPGFPHCRQILYQLSHKGSSRILEWVAYSLSSRSSRSRNLTEICIAGGFFPNWAIRKALSWERASQFEGTESCKGCVTETCFFCSGLGKKARAEWVNKYDREVGVVVMECLLSDSKTFGFYLKCDNIQTAHTAQCKKKKKWAEDLDISPEKTYSG